jgi:hypothetical protein
MRIISQKRLTNRAGCLLWHVTKGRQRGHCSPSLFLTHALHGPFTHVLAYTPTPTPHTPTRTPPRRNASDTTLFSIMVRKTGGMLSPAQNGVLGMTAGTIEIFAVRHSPTPSPIPLLSPHGGVCASFIDWPRATPCDALPLFVGCHE